MSASKSPLMTVSEVAEVLQLNTNAVYRMLKEGKFPAKAVQVGRVWRINRADFYEVFGL